MTVHKLSVWDLCRVCCEQMFGGPRCTTHNLTPEQREAAAAAAHAEKNRETVERLREYLEARESTRAAS